MILPEQVIGVVLAGGRSSRFDPSGAASKATQLLAGKPLVTHVIDRLRPQVSQVWVNSNRDIPLVSGIVDKVLPDVDGGFPGPLAGLHTAMAELSRTPVTESQIEAIMVAPCDGPFMPLDLVASLCDVMAKQGALCATVAWQGVWQPTWSLWHRQLHSRIKEELEVRGRGGFKALLSELHGAVVEWPRSGSEPFLNINCPQDLARAEHLLADQLVDDQQRNLPVGSHDPGQ